MNEIDGQIRETYNKVFYEIIDETVNSKEPDYDWIVRLYAEIKHRLIKFIKVDSKVYKQIDDDFDIELFKQMIMNDVFNAESLFKLVNNTFNWVKKAIKIKLGQTQREHKQGHKRIKLQSCTEIDETLQLVRCC